MLGLDASQIIRTKRVSTREDSILVAAGEEFENKEEAARELGIGDAVLAKRIREEEYPDYFYKLK